MTHVPRCPTCRLRRHSTSYIRKDGSIGDDCNACEAIRERMAVRVAKEAAKKANALALKQKRREQMRKADLAYKLRRKIARGLAPGPDPLPKQRQSIIQTRHVATPADLESLRAALARSMVLA